MQDNRWCDNCGSDRGTKKVSWYYSPETDEVSLCERCFMVIRQWVDDLQLIKD